MYPDDTVPELSPELSYSLMRFLEASVEHILAHQDAERYFAELDDIVEASGLGAWFTVDMPFWMLGRSVWNRVPLPAQQFQSAPLPAPRRNDPCPCGSGSKYKRCCQPFESEHTLSLEASLPIAQIAVEHFTQPQRQAAAKSAPAEVRFALAVDELEAQHPGKARNLLLDLVKRGGLSTERQTEAVQLLGNAYALLGHFNAGEKQLKALVPTLKPDAAAQALCWLATRCLDDDRPQDALAYVLHAEGLVPDHLVVGILKTLALRELGDDAQAQRTAQEWLPVALEVGDEDAIELLEEQASLAALNDAIASNDADWEPTPPDKVKLRAIDEEAYALLGIPEPLLRPLVALLEEALKQPLAAVHFDPGPPPAEDERAHWVLVLPEAVEQAQAAFYQAGVTQSVLDAELIRRHPALLQSLDFLELLEEFIGDPTDPLQARFNAALFEQQERVLSHLLDALPAGGQLPWEWPEHRPVLRLLMEIALDQEDLTDYIAQLSRLLELCPNDNLGVRAPLVNTLLQEGRDTEALAICERYPDDLLPETRYGRVLALLRLNRLHDAEQALAGAYQALPKVLTYLVASQRRKQPSPDPHGTTIGGAEQAWYYREEMRDTFLATPGALSWIDNTRKKPRAP